MGEKLGRAEKAKLFFPFPSSPARASRSFPGDPTRVSFALVSNLPLEFSLLSISKETFPVEEAGVVPYIFNVTFAGLKNVNRYIGNLV